MKEINIEPIAFDELGKYNDGNSFVIIALALEHNQEEAQGLAKELQECGLCEGKEIKAIRFIEKGKDDGRSDYLVEYKADKPISPI